MVLLTLGVLAFPGGESIDTESRSIWYEMCGRGTGWTSRISRLHHQIKRNSMNEDKVSRRTSTDPPARRVFRKTV